MKKLTLIALIFATSAAQAERYPEGYADDRAAIVDLQGRYVMAMDYFDADGYASRPSTRPRAQSSTPSSAKTAA